MAKEDQLSAAEKDFSTQFHQSRVKRRRRRFITAIVVLAGVGGTYYYYLQQQGPAGAGEEPLIVEIGYGDIENAIPAAGTLQPREVVPVGARASGQLEEILVEVGEMVEEGQLLARIDAEEQKLRVDQSLLGIRNQENQLQQRRLEVRNTKNDYDRTRMLWEADAATDQELESAENRWLSAETQLRNLEISIEQSQASLEQEEVQLRYTEIYAPLAGTIITLDQKEGATLNASQTAPTVMQIADLSILTVQVEISEADISQIDIGTEVYFTTLGGGDRRWNGELRQVLPMPTNSNNVVLFTGRFDVNNEDGELYPGMTTQVFFVTSSAEDVLVVPLGALTFTDTAPAREGQGMAGRQNIQNLGEAEREEMRQRIEQMRAQGGFDGGNFPGGSSPENFRGFGNGGGGGFGNGGGRGGQGGRSAAGSIPLNEPRDATVELVQDDGTIVVREVVVGLTDRVNAEVISGLEPGDRVIAGTVLPDVEEEENSNNNNNNNWRGMPRGMFFG
jgi:macrolide-specific efflux system membrane fusion protein